MAPPSYNLNFDPNLSLTFRISVWKNYVYYTPLKQNLLSLITGITFRICMKKNVMPDSLTKLNFDPSPVLELQNLCGRILSTILLWAKIWPLPVLNLQNSHEEICYAWFSNKLNFDPSPVLDPQDLCVEVLYVLEAVEVSDGEHEQEPVPLPHILLPHRAELLLTRRVQYYKQGEKVGQYNRTKK